jgi:AraC-like DNA-binding protein
LWPSRIARLYKRANLIVTSPKSYHVLFDSVAPESGGETAWLARSVRSVVSGFVSHGEYAAAAQAAAERRWTLRYLERRLQQSIDADANPIAALLRTADAKSEFSRRWNAFNRLANLGVSTLISADAGAGDMRSLVRLPQTRDADTAFRAQLTAQCMELASSAAGEAARWGDRPERLAELANGFGLAGTALADLIALLYVQPSFEVGACAGELACSARTLQRELARAELTFGAVKQAVRLTIAGYRLRHLEEPVTETAHAAGFFDSAHFNHAWRRACDITPSAYRALAWAPSAARA